MKTYEVVCFCPRSMIVHLVLGVELDLEQLGAIDLAPCALADDLGGEHKVLWLGGGSDRRQRKIEKCWLSAHQHTPPHAELSRVTDTQRCIAKQLWHSVAKHHLLLPHKPCCHQEWMATYQRRSGRFRQLPKSHVWCGHCEENGLHYYHFLTQSPHGKRPNPRPRIILTKHDY